MAVASGLQQLDASYNPRWLEVEDTKQGKKMSTGQSWNIMGFNGFFFRNLMGFHGIYYDNILTMVISWDCNGDVSWYLMVMISYLCK